MTEYREELLSIRDLHVSIAQGRAEYPIIDGVDLLVSKRRTVGIVGESGCGKSVFARAIIRLLEYDKRFSISGELIWKGISLPSLNMKQMPKIRGSQIAMVFQDPITSLDPLYPIGTQLVDVIRAHSSIPKESAKEQAIDLLKSVDIQHPEKRFSSYPSELSGGMLQRIAIAMALACKPDLLIADEPTTSLDTTTQAQILEIIAERIATEGMSLIFISHDLEVVREICRSVNVMYRGKFVEKGPVNEVFDHPAHPYTQGLIASIPPLEGQRIARLSTIDGSVPPLTSPRCGCVFASRCPLCEPICKQKTPPVVNVQGDSEEHLSDCDRSVDNADDDHSVSCWLYSR